jgi:mannose-6-phosphate isomerase-like protein (cupin superfamily)
MVRIAPILLLFASLAAAQQPACKYVSPGTDDALIASPANHSVLYEDADVRVLDVHSQPHTREEVHTHRLPSVMYIERQGAGTYDTGTPDQPGTGHRSHPTDPNFTPRVIAIQPEGPHWTENTGDVPFHAIRVEFRHPGCGLPGWKPATPGPTDELAIVPSTHKVLLDNDEVRVVDITVPPHTREPYYTEPWAGVLYASAGGRLNFTARNYNLATGKVVAVGPVKQFAFENLGDTPLHLVWFELKHATWMGR